MDNPGVPGRRRRSIVPVCRTRRRTMVRLRNSGGRTRPAEWHAALRPPVRRGPASGAWCPRRVMRWDGRCPRRL